MRKDASKCQHMSLGFSVYKMFLCWISNIIISIVIVIVINRVIIIASHGLRAGFGTAWDWFRSPSPVWGPSPVKSTGYAWQQLLQIGISTVLTFLDWLWTFGRKARLVKFRLGLGDGGVLRSIPMIAVVWLAG